jgi:creatinine amidohydrolase/Fe(II)-dependent formamide hydrolase-like protein
LEEKLSPVANLGDPTVATAETGERAINLTVDLLYEYTEKEFGDTYRKKYKK